MWSKRIFSQPHCILFLSFQSTSPVVYALSTPQFMLKVIALIAKVKQFAANIHIYNSCCTVFDHIVKQLEKNTNSLFVVRVQQILSKAGKVTFKQLHRLHHFWKNKLEFFTHKKLQFMREQLLFNRRQKLAIFAILRV